MSHSEITQIANVNKTVINPATEERQILQETAQTTQEIMMAQLVNLLMLSLGNIA